MSQPGGPARRGSAQDPANGMAGPGPGSVPGGDHDVAEGEIIDDAVSTEVAADLIPDPGEEAASDTDPDVVEAVELARRFEAERDEYLDHLRRLQAEFENFKRRVETQASDVRDRAAVDLVRELLPVLDTCDAALSHGNEDIAPIRTQLLQTLEKQGLEPVAEAGVLFDPNVHEAVMHEPGEGDAVVAEVMRTGYLWRGNVVRAAMVKVRG